VAVTGGAYADALEAAEAWERETGAISIHAYDQPATVAGQGTLGREIEEDAPALDTLIVAVGGGGLIGGIAAWYAGRVRLVAVESEGTATLNQALAHGPETEIEVGGIAASALGASRIGRIAYELARRHVAQSLLVSDAEIAAARKLLWEKARIAAEPGGAAALAALASGRYRPADGERVGVLICGANTDPASLAG
jgi:threonine dehydratase